MLGGLRRSGLLKACCCDTGEADLISEGGDALLTEAGDALETE